MLNLHVNVIYAGIHFFRLTEAHQQPSGLIVQAITARNQFSKCTGSAEPCFQIQFLGGGMVQGSGDNVHDAIWNVEDLAEEFSVANHLVHHFPGFIVMRGGQHKLLDLLKLMDAENASGITTVAANFLTEAC